MTAWDYAVVGAGMAGASVGWQLAQAGASVLVLEREPQPGYHSTGRSAALFMETYGTPAIRALTRASRAFYAAPPAGFASAPLLTPRGVVYLAGPGQEALLERTYAELRPHAPGLERQSDAQLQARLPCLRPGAVAAGLWEPGAADIDVHALHQGYLRGLRQRGGALRTGAEVLALAREGGGWRIGLAGGDVVRARHVVNEPEIRVRIEEVLRDRGVGPGFHLVGEMLKVQTGRARLRMVFRVGSHLDVEPVAGLGADKLHELRRITKFTDLAHARGQVAAQLC
ncbi:MAG: FAD-binding oxidoreductase, partial [Comamonadaceae bacterium]|nr:FAD-binding oxidoreductase [Comamonadaceae bacterium]